MIEEHRVQLEKRYPRIVRWLWALTILSTATTAVATVSLLKTMANASGSPKELRTERLVIVDQSGNAIGAFGRDDNGGFLQVGGGESLVTILAGKAGSVVAQHGEHMSYMSADRDVCLFKISNPKMEAAVKSTASMEECAFWAASNARGRVYMGINHDHGASGFFRSETGENAWEASEKQPIRR